MRDRSNWGFLTSLTSATQIAACLLGLQMAVPVSGNAQTARVRVEVTGIDGVARANVLSVMSLAAAAREGDLPAERIRRLHHRAPGEIELALQPFGFHRPVIDSELISEGTRWTARYRIDPGVPLKISRIRLTLNGAGMTDTLLQQAVARFPLAQGDAIRHDLYELGKATLATRAASLGYLDAAFDTSAIRIDLEAYSAEVVLHFNTGPRFVYGPVTFKQEVLDPGVLSGYVTFRRGQPIDASQLLRLQSALSGGPYFSRVEVRPRRDLADGLEVPIEVELVPRKPQRYEAGFGYGTDTGPRGTFEVEQRRLNRQGHRAAGDTKVSLIEQSVTARYVIPSRHPRTEVLTFFAGFAHLAPTSSASDKIVAGATLTRSRGSWDETFSLTYEREAFTVGPDSGTSNLLIPSASWTRTQADDRIFTRNGFRLRLQLLGSYESFLSSTSFLLGSAHGKVIVSPARRTRLIARADVGGNLTSDFRELPPTIRFFAGGDQSVRGFKYRSLGPRDDAGVLIGGSGLLALSAEIEQRLLERWGIAVFYDVGNAMNSLSSRLEQGAGLGLRWLSPVGLVRVDGALAISQPGTPFRLHLAIGPEL